MGYPDRTMLPDHLDAATLGRAVVADGRLKTLRETLGITRSAMSELLHTNPVRYADWERRPDIKLRPATAERIGRFYYAATQEIMLLEDAGLDVANMVPFHVVATLLGVPQELLLQWYRDGRIEAIDTGILGLWVPRRVLDELRRGR